MEYECEVCWQKYQRSNPAVDLVDSIPMCAECAKEAKQQAAA
jgi:hypothetical protein